VPPEGRVSATHVAIMACGQLLRSASVWSHGVSVTGTENDTLTGTGGPVAALLCTTLVTP